MVTDAAGPQRAPSGCRANVTAGQSVVLLSAGWGLGGPAPRAAAVLAAAAAGSPGPQPA